MSASPDWDVFFPQLRNLGQNFFEAVGGMAGQMERRICV